MTIFLDLIGSWVVRASMIAVMLGLTVNLNDALYTSTQAANNNGYVAVIDSVVYADVNDAGYNVSDLSTTFQVADSTDLKFYADINGDGVPETLEYSMTQQPDSTYNFYRTASNVNSGNPSLIGNVQSLVFHYYDSKGNQTSDLTKIKQIRVTVSASATTDFKIYPPNLL